MAAPHAFDGPTASSASDATTLDAAGGWRSTWARPPDVPAQVALGLAVVLLAGSLTRRGTRWMASWLDFAAVRDLDRHRRFLAVASFAAAFLSLGYIGFYLRGGPRAIDAAVYFLQGRVLSHGHWTWAAGEPTANFHASQLLLLAPDRLAGIFPPGFPILLASGFLVGAPMVVGPVLAAILVVATWWLARELAIGAGESRGHAEGVARIAAGLSIVCAALRYHTADTLPHGAAAVALATAFAAALRGCRTGHTAPRNAMALFGASGFALGALVATQPRSGLAIGAVVLGLGLQCPRRAHALAWTAAAAVPGVLVLLAANHAAVGRAFVSPSAVYFALAGAARSSAAGGGMAGAVASRSLERVRAHAFDVANFEPLSLLPLVVLFGKRRPPAHVGWWAALIVVGQLVAYAPIATEDVGPGAGAGVLADVLPIDHALIALALVRLFPRDLGRAAAATLGFALAGFAVHASYAHGRLAASDIGRPRFEPDVPREGGVTTGLLFFDDDTGYELAYDPATAASLGLEAVRMRGDDHDRLVFEALGRPASHRYFFSPSNRPGVIPWAPGGTADLWRFESESEWPPVSATRGSAHVDTIELSCVSGGRALVLTPSGSSTDSVTIELPVPRDRNRPERRTWIVTPRVIARSTGAEGSLVLVPTGTGPPLARWSWSDDASTPPCRDLNSQTIDLGSGRDRYWLVLQANRGAVALDRTILRAR
jgi:hypothetical protein